MSLEPERIRPELIRKDFPILQTRMRAKPLVYLDTAASAQKPQVVIDSISNFYTNDYANIHRGLYELSETATRMYEEAREKQIVSGLIERNPGPFPDDGLGPVFREVISATRSLEEGGVVAYMGPEGTFSHQAACLKFGRLAQLESAHSHKRTFRHKG